MIKLLDGIRVIDFTRILAGPITTMILGDLGAEIVKVEPPRGDDTRYWAPMINGVSVYFLTINRNKKSIVIDLKKDLGKELIYRLVEKADIVIENFREGVAKKLGIDYDTLRKVKEDIIYCSIKGYRSDTIYSKKSGADLIIQSMSGLMDTIGIEGGEPIKVSFAVFDVITGLIASISVLSALYYRYLTGRGMMIETPLYDSSIFSMVYIPMIYLMTGEKPRKMGSAHPSIVPYQAFKCRDGKYITVGVFNEDMWIRFCNAIGLRNLINDERFRRNVDRVRNREKLVKILSKRFLDKDSEEWIKIFDYYNIPSGPVYSIDEVFRDQYIREAEIISNMPHKVLDNVKQILYPSLFNGERLKPDKSPPEKGENAIEILKRYGFRDEEIDKLFRENVICCK